MESVRDLEGFAALVYSSNFEFEVLGSKGGSSSAAATTTGDASRSDSGKADEAPGLGGGSGSVVTGEGASRLESGEADHQIPMQEKEGEVGGGEGEGKGEASLVQEPESGFEDAWGKVVAAGSGWGGGDGQGPMTG